MLVGLVLVTFLSLNTGFVSVGKKRILKAVAKQKSDGWKCVSNCYCLGLMSSFNSLGSKKALKFRALALFRWKDSPPKRGRIHPP